jgi:hypothetical protein
MDNGQLTMDNYLASNSGVILSFELAIDGYCCIEN